MKHPFGDTGLFRARSDMQRDIHWKIRPPFLVLFQKEIEPTKVEMWFQLTNNLMGSIVSDLQGYFTSTP